MGVKVKLCLPCQAHRFKSDNTPDPRVLSSDSYPRRLMPKNDFVARI